MSKDKNEYLIDTDVLVDHLIYRGNEKSHLEKLMESGICFTTVINSAELYFTVRDNIEKDSVDALMKAVTVLGFHARYSLLVSEFAEKVNSVRDALFCVTAKINKLKVVTENINRYSNTELEIIDPKNL